jgi:hypothetical protein
MAARRDKPLAPANDHVFPSSSATVSAPEIFGAAPSKTHLLRCVHKVQAPRITREFIPFFNMSPTVLLTISHHKWKEVFVGCGAKVWSPNREKSRYQNSLANTQRTKM